MKKCREPVVRSIGCSIGWSTFVIVWLIPTCTNYRSGFLFLLPFSSASICPSHPVKSSGRLFAVLSIASKFNVLSTVFWHVINCLGVIAIDEQRTEEMEMVADNGSRKSRKWIGKGFNHTVKMCSAGDWVYCPAINWSIDCSFLIALTCMGKEYIKRRSLYEKKRLK